MGSEVLFAGGRTAGGGFSNVVDIYDAATATWSTAALSQAREDIATASVGNKVFFAGGDYLSGGTWIDSNVVDIYTLQSYGAITSSKTWTLVDQTTVTGQMQLNSGASLNLGGYNLNVGSMSGAAPINLGNQTLTVGTDNTDTTYTGTLSGSGGLTKTGAGALTLAASNIYSGVTEVDDGTLVAANGSNGSATGSGTVTLSGGTLASASGGGSISGGVVVGSVASEIAPGGIGSIGTLTIGSLLTSSKLTLNFDLTTPGGSGDLLTITNGLTVGQGTPITFGTNPPTVPGEYPLIGGNYGTPNLSYFDLPAAPVGETYSLATVGGYIDLVVVPEPSTFALLGIGAIGLLGWAWRRRRAS